jgi:hypothetical protein
LLPEKSGIPHVIVKSRPGTIYRIPQRVGDPNRCIDRLGQVHRKLLHELCSVRQNVVVACNLCNPLFRTVMGANFPNVFLTVTPVLDANLTKRIIRCMDVMTGRTHERKCRDRRDCCNGRRTKSHSSRVRTQVPWRRVHRRRRNTLCHQGQSVMKRWRRGGQRRTQGVPYWREMMAQKVGHSQPLLRSIYTFGPSQGPESTWD